MSGTGTAGFEVVDLQVHAPGPVLDWDGDTDDVRSRVLQESMWQMMDAVGVDAVVLNPVADETFALNLVASDPGRFAINKMLRVHGARVSYGVTPDVGAPDILERVGAAAAEPGVKAFRAFISARNSPEQHDIFEAGGYDAAFAACEKVGIPLRLYVSGCPEDAATVARAYPDLQILVDHFGLPQPPLAGVDDVGWEGLDAVLALARYANIALVLTAAPALSRQSYPYTDIWGPVERVLETFGLERVAWASDISRIRGKTAWQDPLPSSSEYRGRHTYMESLAFWRYTDRLSASDKAKVLGQTARRLLNWPRPRA